MGKSKLVKALEDKYKIASDRWLSDENINALLESKLADNRDINAVNYNLDPIGAPNPNKPKVAIGGAVSIAQLGDVFEQLYKNTGELAIQGGVAAPKKYIVPINVDAEASAGKEVSKSGNHWALAVIERGEGGVQESGAYKPNVSVEYIDPLSKEASANNAKAAKLQLAAQFNLTKFENLSKGQQKHDWECGYITTENAIKLVSGKHIQDKYNPLQSEELYNGASEVLARLNQRDQAYSPKKNVTFAHDAPSQKQPQKIDDSSRIKDKSRWLTNAGLDKLIRLSFRGDKEVNAFNSDFDLIGAAKPERASVVISEAVRISDVDEKFKNLYDSMGKSWAKKIESQGVVSPTKTIIPLNVNAKGEEGKEGDHWVLAVIKKEKGSLGKKPNISVQYIDPAREKGENDPNLTTLNKRLSKNFNIKNNKIEDLSQKQQPDGWACGYITALNANVMAKDASEEALRKFTKQESEQLYTNAAKVLGSEEGRTRTPNKTKRKPYAFELRDEIQDINGVIKSLGYLKKEVGPNSFFKTTLEILHKDKDKPAGKQKGLIGRLENIINDFNIDDAGYVILSLFSVIKNVVGLLGDVAKTASKGVNEANEVNKNIEEDIKRFKAYEKELKKELKQKKLESKSLNKGLGGGLGNGYVPSPTPSVGFSKSTASHENSPRESGFAARVSKSHSIAAKG